MQSNFNKICYSPDPVQCSSLLPSTKPVLPLCYGRKTPEFTLKKKTENKKAVSILPPGWQQQKAL